MKHVPLKLITRIAAAVMLVMAGVSITQAVVG
jgi:hypothetical protein